MGHSKESFREEEYEAALEKRPSESTSCSQPLGAIKPLPRPFHPGTLRPASHTPSAGFFPALHQPIFPEFIFSCSLAEEAF